MNVSQYSAMPEAPILQVEDDENDVLLLQYAFECAGLERAVHAVSDGQEAIDYLAGEGTFADRSRHPIPCMVLLDIKLPRRSGLEVLQWMRAREDLRGIIVIMFSASSYHDEISQAYRSGANSFLIKPAGADELTKLVQVIKAYWFDHNRFTIPAH